MEAEAAASRWGCRDAPSALRRRHRGPGGSPGSRGEVPVGSEGGERRSRKSRGKRETPQKKFALSQLGRRGFASAPPPPLSYPHGSPPPPAPPPRPGSRLPAPHALREVSPPAPSSASPPLRGFREIPRDASVRSSSIHSSTRSSIRGIRSSSGPSWGRRVLVKRIGPVPACSYYTFLKEIPRQNPLKKLQQQQQKRLQACRY